MKFSVRSLLLVFSAATALLPSAAAWCDDITVVEAAAVLHCPQSQRVTKSYPVHTSMVIYHTVSDNIWFWTAAREGLDYPKSSFIGALIRPYKGPQPGWELVCRYRAENGETLLLTTSPNEKYASCQFADGSLSCEGPSDACAFRCPQG